MANHHADLASFLHAPADSPDGRATFIFRHQDDLATTDAPLRGDLSGVRVQDNHAWTISDELCALERLTRTDVNTYGDHRSYDLNAFFTLPAATEMDLEGVACDGDYVWLLGSHSLKRKKPRPHKDDAAKTIRRLGRIARDENRYFLGRVPLLDQGDGPEPVVSTPDGRTAAAVRMREGANDLVRVLADDPYIAPFLHVPAKENGFDIEGIAVHGDRVLLGLRGPVLRGMAIMIELAVSPKEDGRLKLRKAFGDGARYRLHFLDLGGMGIRDMTLAGQRLHVLVGPTMDLDGPCAVVALDNPFGHLADVTFADSLHHVVRIPHGPDTDHAEGLAVTSDERLLVAYDSPDPSRLHDDGRSKDLDLFTPRIAATP